MHLKQLLIIVFILAGCSASKAPDIPNNWRPMNAFNDEAVAIPLIKQHIYQVTNMDITVKGLLERWGEEAKMPVLYDYPDDFTLFKSVAEIKQSDLNNALKDLSQMYENKGIIFYIKDNVIFAHKKLIEENQANE